MYLAPTERQERLRLGPGAYSGALMPQGADAAGDPAEPGEVLLEAAAATRLARGAGRCGRVPRGKR
ncbi:hypothetical protein SCWH03_49820 [Streptomyces pacificus]|uniref:Uncharacterized protein n=1 Tax=Streptomyces pacificus TaxID=2705029 RepID=A0A6A0B1Z3_9ACTN|nr:hypothetical protein SCWH03_49820 [Streptomyces pacificus]